MKKILVFVGFVLLSVFATNLFAQCDVPAKPSISGPTEVCENTTESYSVIPVTGSGYNWRVVPGEAVVSSNYDKVSLIEFVRQSTQSGTTGKPVIIEVTAINTCGPSEPAFMEVDVNLAPRAADYVGSTVGLQSGATRICETTTGEILETTPTGTNVTEYRWMFAGNDLGTTTVPSKMLPRSEMPAFTDGTEIIKVEYGNACGYYDAEATEYIELEEERPFNIEVTLDNELLIDSVIDKDLYAICGLEDAFDIRVQGAAGVDLTGIDVDYEVTILGTTTTFDNIPNGELTLPEVTGLTDGEISVKATIDPSGACFTTTSSSDKITLRDYTFQSFSIAGLKFMCEDDEDITYIIDEEQVTADDRHNKIDTVIWTLGNGDIRYGSSISISSQEAHGGIFVELINVNGCNYFTTAFNSPYEVRVDQNQLPALDIKGEPAVCLEDQTIFEYYLDVQDSLEFSWFTNTGEIIEGRDSSHVFVKFSPGDGFLTSQLKVRVNDNTVCEKSFSKEIEIDCEKAVGINGIFSEIDLELYPNPFTTSFNLTGLSEVEKMEVFNLSGQLVESYTSKNDLGLTLPKGNYVLKIHTASEIVYKKIMKR